MTNQLPEVVGMMEKRQQVKAQAILSNFKKDVATVERALVKLKKEQEEIQRNKKPA